MVCWLSLLQFCLETRLSVIQFKIILEFIIFITNLPLSKYSQQSEVSYSVIWIPLIHFFQWATQCFYPNPHTRPASPRTLHLEIIITIHEVNGCLCCCIGPSTSDEGIRMLICSTGLYERFHKISQLDVKLMLTL